MSDDGDVERRRPLTARRGDLAASSGGVGDVSASVPVPVPARRAGDWTAEAAPFVVTDRPEPDAQRNAGPGGDIQAAYAQGREDERGRIKGIMTALAAVGRDGLARHLAFEVGMSVEDAVGIMAAAPAADPATDPAPGGRLRTAMAPLVAVDLGDGGGEDARPHPLMDAVDRVSRSSRNPGMKGQ